MAALHMAAPARGARLHDRDSDRGAAAPRRMKDEAALRDFVAAQPAMLSLLQSVAAHGPPRAWIGAGFIRNAVWDACHGRAGDCATLADLDVVFFDVEDRRPQRDAAAESALHAAAPGWPWSVTNQARMAARNGHPPYADLADAVAHWPETATAVAARWSGGVEILAPHGVADLLGMVLRPTPAFAARQHVLRARMESKRWLVRWPRLALALTDA